MHNQLIANNPTQTGSSQLTMSSREIAELTGKQHKDVMRDIRNMLEEINQRTFAPVDYTDGRGRKQPEYRLPKRETIILISGYNIRFRARIIDRWQELEEAVNNPARVLNDPAALRGLLSNYAEKVLALEEESRLLTHNLSQKEQILKRIHEQGQAVLPTEAAKILQIPPRQLSNFCQQLRWIYKTKNASSWLANQRQIKAGYLKHKVSDFRTQNGHKYTTTQLLFTPKGLTRLAGLLEQEFQSEFADG